LAASRKHALLKSPTESKFVALTDGMKSFWALDSISN
jgi:hypothetical protein